MYKRQIIEATAGNTGIGLALVAAIKGYKLILVIPDKMSREKILHLEGLGAEVRISRSDVSEGHPEHYQEVARKLAAQIPGSFYADQFSNPANPLAHSTSTAPEIWDQMEGKLDAIVGGVGSGGTLTGLAEFFKEKNPNIQMVVADPVGSVVADAVTKGTYSYKGGSWFVEGIGEDFIPTNLFSIWSTLPTPCSPAISLRFLTIATPLKDSPFYKTGIPESKVIITSMGSSGA